MIMKMTEDREAWHEAWLDTPLSPPPHHCTRDQAFQTPGCRVKSQERDLGGWPRYFGILVACDLDEVVVRSYGPEDPVSLQIHPASNGCAVWRGTLRQYFNDWECD